MQNHINYDIIKLIFITGKIKTDMKKLTVSAQKPYNIYFVRDVFSAIKENTCTVHIVADENTVQYIPEHLPNNICLHTVPQGEESKSFDMFRRVSCEILKQGIQRKDLLAAFGGGVVGDLTGFIASVLLRGVDYIQIPTTLLAMIDSSVGGKTAINTDFGKNLIGSFCQPKAVYINTDYLKTLPKKNYRDGMAEAIKYSLISDLDLDDTQENIIYNCCRIKADIVSRDEKDTGIRKILNFGHTIGHAVEQYYSYKYTHGEGVAIGMYCAGVISEKLSLCKNISPIIKEMLIKHSLPYELPPIGKDELANLISKDKKNSGSTTDFILLEGIGKPIIKKLTPKEAVSLL